MTQKIDVSRSYNGMSQLERRADRCMRLIAAAVDVYGEQGYRKASIKAVCEAAGLTERYFYESFASSEQLLIACYNAVTDRLLKDIVKAANIADTDRRQRAHAMLHAYFTAIKRDPKSAQVFLVEIRGANQTVDEVFHAALRRIAREALRILGVAESPSNALLAVGIVGGISQIALEWALQGYAPPMEEVVNVALQLANTFLEQV